MSIINFPNRVYKTVVPSIDRVMAKRKPLTARGSQNLAGGALDVVISPNTDWQIDSIAFSFNNAIARTYGASIIQGTKIITNYNDYLWFQTNDSLWQQITLDTGFYNGTQLATELQTQLNANAAFVALGKTFVVAYNAATGLFTITPSFGTIRYLSVNTSQTLRTRDSIAGHLFGLTATTAFAANVQSDTAVFGLNDENPIINEVGNTDLSDYSNDLHILSIDQALSLWGTTGPAVIIDYTVVYEEIV